MCAIAGLLHLDPAPPPRRETLQAMVDCLAHRGPDGQGLWLDDRAALGHARLSLVDLQGGAQPLCNEDHSLQLVFNGEVYNHRELRQGLERRGHRLRTGSDAEVVLHLYEEQGDDAVQALNGPFAFALWDQRQRRLLLARDRVGMRPLLWTQQGARLAFASEAKALLSLPGQHRALDLLALAETLQLWSPLAPRTAFEGIHALPPGHTLSIDARGRHTLNRYWDWSFDIDPTLAARPMAELAEEARALLTDAVRLQRQADVPVGVLLSGGLDSSVLAALSAAHGGAGEPATQAFSLGFDDAEYDERSAQAAAQQGLALQAQVRVCGSADIAAAFPRAVWHAEQPLVRTAAAPLMLLAATVRQAGVKAVLSGEGADEVFAGYDLFKEAQLRRFVARNPSSHWRHRLLGRLYPYLRHSPTGPGSLASSTWQRQMPNLADPVFAHQPRLRSGTRALALIHPDLRPQLTRHPVHAELAAQLPLQARDWQPLARDQYLECHTLLSGHLLSAQGDRMAMAHGIELRHPFLDHRLIEWVGRLPAAFKLRGLREKRLLREAMRGHMPEAARQRTKQPYRTPDSRCFFDAQSQLHEAAQAVLAPSAVAASGLFDPAVVQALVAKCAAGRAIGYADNLAFVSVVSTLLLHQQFIAGAQLKPPSAAAARSLP